MGATERRLDAHGDRRGAGLAAARRGCRPGDAHHERQRAVARDGVAHRPQTRDDGSSRERVVRVRAVVLFVDKVFDRVVDRVVSPRLVDRAQARGVGGRRAVPRDRARRRARDREPVDERHGDFVLSRDAAAGQRVRRESSAAIQKPRFGPTRATERLERGDGFAGRRREGDERLLAEMIAALRRGFGTPDDRRERGNEVVLV